MIVFAVFSGEYSDRGLDAIFSTKEKAEKYIEHKKLFSSRGWCEVDDSPTEYELDAAMPPKNVWFRIDGDSSEIEPHDGRWLPETEDGLIDNGEEAYVMVKYNDNIDVCKKAARDKIAARRARNIGI